tara:strand:- start:40 stop:294 length:255 start_codon:yes stop_codon:yes gene_type:complete
MELTFKEQVAVVERFIDLDQYDKFARSYENIRKAKKKHYHNFHTPNATDTPEEIAAKVERKRVRAKKANERYHRIRKEKELMTV